jgi:hypothetical protein
VSEGQHKKRCIFYYSCSKQIIFSSRLFLFLIGWLPEGLAAGGAHEALGVPGLVHHPQDEPVQDEAAARTALRYGRCNNICMKAKTTKYALTYSIFSTEQCLASSELLTPIPSPPSECPPPAPKAGGGVHTRRVVRGWGVNISEDARHWIGLLQYNPSTAKTSGL